MAQLETAADVAVSDDADGAAAETHDALIDLYADDEAKSGDDADGEGADQPGDEGADDAADAPGEDGDDQPDDDGPAIPPPASWSKDDRAEWDALPRAMRETIARREGERDRFVQAKASEAATANQRAFTEANRQLAEVKEASAAEFRRYAAMFEPQPPDMRLLYTGNPQDQLTYQQQDAAYRAAQGHQQQLNQRAESEAAEAQRIRDEQDRASRAEDSQKLHAALPEWFDPQEGTKLRQTLQSIGAELGYPTELMAEANSTDILALRKAQSWKEKADKYDALQRDKMKHVRAAKQLPKSAQPGATQVTAKSVDPLKLLYPDD